MSWHVFGGEWHEQFLAALKERCVKDGLDISPDTLNRQFRLHLHRGISYLTTPGKIRNIRDFIQIALIDEDFKINGQKLGDFF
jgi:DNA sulfur modification protein DndE